VNPNDNAAGWLPWQWKLHWQILLGLVLGAVGGWLLAGRAESLATADQTAKQVLAAHPVRQIAETGGEMFLAALKMIVIPLVVSSIILSIASISNRSGFARLGFKTLLFYGVTGVFAILVGLVLVNIFRPGVSKSGQPLLTSGRMEAFAGDFSAEAEKLKASRAQDSAKSGDTMFSKVLGVFRSLVPSSVIKSMLEMDLLGIITWSLLFGYFMGRLPEPYRPAMENVCEGIYRVSLAMTGLVLRFAPLGVGCLLVKSISENMVALSGDQRIGEFAGALQWFAITVVLALAIHLFGVMSLVMWLVGRVNPWTNLKAFSPALLTAFSTASSNATISVTLDCAERRAGVSKEISSFVIPLGATANMNGTALYECVAAIFVAQLFGIQLDFSIQFMIVIVALLTSVGVAGVPSASLVAILIILESVSKQLTASTGTAVDLTQGLPILMILDRPLDMCRTAVNVFGDGCAAVAIARTEGERPFEQVSDPGNASSS
jgi:proton glutamate symport protein